MLCGTAGNIFYYAFRSAQFLRTGLWETCFRSHSSPDDLEQRKFYVGCRWILTYEYNRLRDTLELPFFVSTQVSYLKIYASNNVVISISTP